MVPFWYEGVKSGVTSPTAGMVQDFQGLEFITIRTHVRVRDGGVPVLHGYCKRGWRRVLCRIES